MDAAEGALERKKLQLLAQLAELEVEQQRGLGLFNPPLTSASSKLRARPWGGDSAAFLRLDWPTKSRPASLFRVRVQHGARHIGLKLANEP